MESRKQNKEAEEKQTHGTFGQLPDGRRVGGWVKKVTGLRSINWLLQNSHRDIKYSIGNIINNTVIIICYRWVLDLLR